MSIAITPATTPIAVAGGYRGSDGHQHHQRFSDGEFPQCGGLDAVPTEGFTATITIIPASTDMGISAITSLNPVTNSSNTSPAATVETRLRPLPISTLTMV